MRFFSFFHRFGAVLVVTVYIVLANASFVHAAPAGFRVGNIVATSGSAVDPTRISVEVTPGNKPVHECVFVLNNSVFGGPLAQDAPVIGSPASIYTGEYPLPSGTHTLRVRCVDTVGTEAVSPELTFVVASTDTTGPVVVTPALSSEVIYTNQTITVTATAEDNSGLAECRFFLGGIVQSAWPGSSDQRTMSVGFGITSSMLAPGIPTQYYFSCRDVHGNTGVSLTRQVTLGQDAEGPNVTEVDFPSMGVSDQVIMFSMRYHDSLSGVESCTLSAGSSSVNVRAMPFVLVEGATPGSGRASLSYAFTTPGTYAITTRCTDRVGNTSSWNRTITITPEDTTRPTMVFSPPASAIRGFPLMLYATYSDDMGVVRCEMEVQGGIHSLLPEGRPVSGSVSRAHTFTTLGTHPVTIRCADSAGNVGSVSRTILVTESVTAPPSVTPTVDTTAPTLTALAPATAVRGVGTTLSVIYADAVGVTSCSVYLNGSLVGAASLSSPQNGVATRGHTFSSAGTYILKIECRDAAGNLRDSSAVVVVSESISAPATPVTATPVTTTPPPVTTTPTPVTTHPAPAATSAPTRSLIKLACPGYVVAADHACKAVYYYGLDGKRHAFPNAQVYFTWYQDFLGIAEVSPAFMASIPLGKNVTYRPGVRMVKFTTLNRVYAVGRGGVLRWVTTEEVARGLYGTTWARQIDDIADIFFTDYVFGTDVTTSGGFAPQNETLGTTTVDQNW